uniref:Putative secreted protein n=1 Tax=Xenopsylla cheopis TaxID=163159 RepID=A0A6M2DWF8_XENCH
MLISLSYFLLTSTILFSSDSSPSPVLDKTTRSSAFFVVLIFLLSTVKSPMSSSAYLTSHSLEREIEQNRRHAPSLSPFRFQRCWLFP